MEIDADTLWDFGGFLLSDERLGVSNGAEVELALWQLQTDTNSLTSDDVPLPDGFFPPRLALPERGFAPDFFKFSVHWFCSHRLRTALAQPPHVVQYTPVMRVLARQPAMDLGRSECQLEDWINRITGVPQKVPRFIDRFVLLDDLQPRTEIFRIHESSSYVLVTDNLAERVLRAGCTGLEFVDPACPRHGPRVVRYRTADGVGEKRVHMLD